MPLYYKDTDNTWKEFATNPYPIGTLVSLTKDNSPATLVGGTWTKHFLETVYEDFQTVGSFTAARFTWRSNIIYGYLAWANVPRGGKVTNLPRIADSSSITLDSYTGNRRPLFSMHETTFELGNDAYMSNNTTMKFHYTTSDVNPDVGLAAVIYERIT